MNDAPTPSMASLNGRSDSSDAGAADSQVDLHLSNLQSIAGYSVIRPLGQGGSSNVFLCEQLSPNRQVALKLLKLSQCDAHIQQRFQLEADLLATLEHPGIARIYETGLADIGYGRQPYYTMEYIDGQRLDRFIESHSLQDLPIEKRVELFLDIAGAVNCAHEHAIVHRDLKPNNILVTKSLDIKVIDFGLARLVDPKTTAAAMTRTGYMVGTPMYMSPEQFKSDRYLTDHRSDIYSLGLILYEMLCGQKPYEIEDKALIDIANIVLNRSPTPLGKVIPRFKGDLETIVGKSLEKDPADRYQSLQEMSQDLRLFLSGQPINTKRPSVWFSFIKWYRNHLKVASAVTATALLLLATTIAALVSTANSHQRERELTQQAQLLEQSFNQLADTNRQLSESVRLAELSTVNRTLMRTGLIRDSNPNLTRSLLFDTTLVPENRRNFAWKTLDRQSDWLVTQGSWQRGPVMGAAFSQDGSAVAIAASNAIEVRNSNDLSILFRVKDQIASPTLVAMGPRLKQVAFRKENRQLILYNHERREKTELCSNIQECGHSIAFSPSGKIAIGVGKGQIRVWKSLDDPPLEFQIAQSPIVGIRFTPDETALHTTAADGTVQTVKLSDGSVLKSSKYESPGLQKAFFSRDGRYVAGGRSYHRLSVWDRDTGTCVFQNSNPGPYITSALFGSPNLRIGFASRRRVDLFPLDQKSTLLHFGASTVRTLCLSNDESRMLIGDDAGNVFIFRTKRNEVPRSLPLINSKAGIVRFTDDGESILICRGPGNLDLYNTVSGELTISLPQQPSLIADAELDKKGSIVFFSLTSNHVKSWNLLRDAPGQVDIKVKERIVDLALSPDQKQLLGVSRVGSIWRLNLETNQSQFLAAGHEHPCSAIVHSPTKPVFFIADYEGDLSRWDSSSLHLQKRQSGTGSRVTELAVSPDGSVLAAACNDGIVRIYDTNSLSPKTELTVHTSAVRSLDFSPDGTTLATGGMDSQMILWDTNAWQPQSVWDVEGRGIRSTRFSPDGKRLAVCGNHNQIALWETEAPTPTSLITPTSPTSLGDSAAPQTSD